MDEKRLRLLEVSGALLALVVNVVAVVLAASATFAARDAAVASRDQVAIARDERYSDAVAGLGVADATRLASIRELETLSKDASPERKFEISLVVTTYLKSRSDEVRATRRSPDDRVPEDMQQAILTLTAIRGSIDPDARDDLPILDLRGLNINGVLTVGENTDLSRIDFSGGSLSMTDLDSSNLSESNLTEANLAGASLRNVNFTDAVVESADFHCSDLSGADLSLVSGYETANFDGIRYDDNTIWPVDFSPPASSLSGGKVEQWACILAKI